MVSPTIGSRRLPRSASVPPHGYRWALGVAVVVSLVALALPGIWHGVTNERMPGGIGALLVAAASTALVGGVLARSGLHWQVVPYFAIATAVFTAANCFDLLRHQSEDAVPWGALVAVNLVVDGILVGLVVGIGYLIGAAARRTHSDRTPRD